jgi:hypothetical protein
MENYKIKNFRVFDEDGVDFKIAKWIEHYGR